MNIQDAIIRLETDLLHIKQIERAYNCDCSARLNTCKMSINSLYAVKELLKLNNREVTAIISKYLGGVTDDNDRDWNA